MLRHHWKLLTGCCTILLVTASVPGPLNANHSWGGYHWNGESLPVNLDVGNNLTNQWTDHLTDAVSDWNDPSGGATQSVNLIVGPGGTNPATCDPNLGRIEVCNSEYGDNGWLGLAQVWVYRGRDKHIAQATSLLNDTYFDNPSYDYDTWDWRQMVVCQEIAHDFGLDHQDENFWNPNLGTCMDYTAVPEGNDTFGPANTSPNQHDYDQLQDNYAHLVGGSGPGGGGGGGGGRGRGSLPQDGLLPALPDQALQRVPIDSPGAWGQLIRDTGRFSLYELDLGNGWALFTFVTWA